MATTAATLGKNILTDDDFVAMFSRRIANKMISPDLVKHAENTLADSDPHFTTLAAITSCNEIILKESFPPIDRNQYIANLELQSFHMRKIKKVWMHLLKNIEVFSYMLSDKTKSGNERRKEIRRDCLLGKPVPQVCLVNAFIKLINSNRFSQKDASTKLNKIDWRKNADLWEGLLIGSGGKILYKNKNVATDIIYYMCGGKCDEKALLEDYQTAFSPRSKKPLPQKV